MNNDIKTTLAGLGIGGVVLSQVDLPKLVAGDHVQMATVVIGILVGVFGYFTNKGPKNAK
jgi:hypothetical protein